MQAIIIDDERLARKELRNLLTSFPEIEIIGECDNANDAIIEIDKLKPGLIFLDIHMPCKDGFSVLEELYHLPQVIFVTAYDEYAIKAFEVNALDYLLKPIQPERLEEAIKKLSKETIIPSGNDRLTLNDMVFVKDGDNCWFVKLENVPMFESEGNYVRVYFEGHKPLILKSLNNLEKKLDEKYFFRANRKLIINLNWIDKIENWFNGGLIIAMKNGKKVEISRRQTSKLKNMKSL